MINLIETAFCKGINYRLYSIRLFYVYIFIQFILQTALYSALLCFHLRLNSFSSTTPFADFSCWWFCKWDNNLRHSIRLFYVYIFIQFIFQTALCSALLCLHLHFNSFSSTRSFAHFSCWWFCKWDNNLRHMGCYTSSLSKWNHTEL